MILVTGGGGNVGANVVRQLLDAGEKVRVLTRDPGGPFVSGPGRGRARRPDPARNLAGGAIRIIAETIGRPLRFEEQPREQFREELQLHHGLPAPVVDELLDQLAARDGETAQVLPTVEEITGRPDFTYAQWGAHRVAEFDSGPESRSS